MNKKIIFMLTFLILLTVIAGCYYDKKELLYPSSVNCGSVNAKFVNVKLIMSQKCATVGCHNAGSAAGATVLEKFEQVKAKADKINQRAIIERTMPPVTTLSNAEIAILKCWINAGTPNN